MPCQREPMVIKEPTMSIATRERKHSFPPMSSSNLSSKSFWGMEMLREREERRVTPSEGTRLPPVTRGACPVETERLSSSLPLDNPDYEKLYFYRSRSYRPMNRPTLTGLIGIPNSHMKRRRSCILPPLRKNVSEDY